MKKWKTLNEFCPKDDQPLADTANNLLNILLENRGLTKKEEIEQFLHPELESVTPISVGIDTKELSKTIKRIHQAIEKKEEIIIFGDYDVDGITATAILWETLHAMGAKVMPYIPSRFEEGYGLSIKGIENVILVSDKGAHPGSDSGSSTRMTKEKPTLIITVDNGIVANEAVDFAKKQGIDVIITDHHVPGEKLPSAYAIFHTTKLCGAGVAYLLAQELTHSVIARSETTKQSSLEIAALASVARNDVSNHHLELVALATVADLVPLTGANRTLLMFGLKQLKSTHRPGLLALFADAQVDPQKIDVYAIGHMLSPRLNAMGRMASAMDSLRLLCTKDRLRAKVLADMLGNTNRERQVLTKKLAEHAVSSIKYQISNIKKLLFVSHESYEEGVIGLVAGKLVETFYRPAIVLSIGEKISKASARSVAGFNIIEFIRTNSDLLINAGGHPMAAGFTIETGKIALLQEALEKLAEEQLDEVMLTRVLRIDCELPLEYVTQDVYKELQQLAPFGMANPEPTFVSKVEVKEIKVIGKDKSHLKLKISPNVIASEARYSLAPGEAEGSHSKNRHPELVSGSFPIDAIAFGMGDLAAQLKVGQEVDMVYTIDENIWNGKTSLQVKVKDIKTYSGSR